ncbi:MAG: histidine kinase dimerization/phospho-acceptor domain-containing protein [Planctomycetota bacterium]
MTRLYIGEVALGSEVVEGLRRAGFDVIDEKAPLEPADGDLALIGADPGITSSLRHELNNPLTAVIGFAQLLARNPDLTGPVAERMGKIQTHAIRVRDLIQKPESSG